MSYLMKQASLLRFNLMLMLMLVSLPSGAMALGFGALKLSSHLNQALHANVPIILNTSDNIETVRVALASQDEYRQLGLQWQADLAHITVILQAKHSDRPYIALRSVGTIHTPILSVLLKASKTGRGTYYKHFQLLLDPVEITALHQPQPVVMALRSSSDNSDPESLPAPETADTGWARIWSYGPVRVGDSLSEIAYRLRRDKRYSNRQVMLSLYEKNPHGFVDGDINLLKQGAWLTVPRGDVVKQYADQASMQKLSQLLTRAKPAARTIQAPPKPVSKPASKPVAQPKTQPETQTSAPASTNQPAQELRYSGSITVNGATANKLANDLKTVKSGFDQRFDSMHASMMAGKLQMADLGKTVSSLNQSVEVIKQDIHSLKKDVAIIKSRTEHAISESFSDLQLVLFALLAAFFGALIALLFRKKPADAPAPVVSSSSSTTDADASAITTPVLIADEAIQLLNRAEEHLGKCDYKQTEKILRQIDKLTPDSVRASALKAQLFHETDRHTERNNLINSISEASDKQRWERFCQLLPSHVWNACFGGEAADSAPRNDGAQP